MVPAVRHRFASRLAAALVAAVAGLPAHPEPPAESFVVEELAAGVLLFRPAADAPGRVNSLVVEREDGLLVVAAQPSPAAAGELLAAIRCRSTRPVSYLVLPHSHAEAGGGASAFADRVLVIGTTGCRDALARADYDFGAEVRARSTESSAWVEPERPAPVLVLESRTWLADPRNTVELLPLGRSHSRGDLLVRLPEHDVLYAGALLFPDDRPYADDARVGSWLSALNHLVRQRPRVLLPLRGPAVDIADLRGQRDALAWLRGQVDHALRERSTHDEVRDRVLRLPDIGSRFATDSPFLPGLVERVIQEAEARRKKHSGR